MLFAAGKGTRLAPLTDRHPKCLAIAGDKPLLEHNIEKLRDAGVDTLVINVHHFGEQVIDFIRSKDFGLTIRISEEEALLGQGGGLLKAADHFRNEGAFIVCNSDVYSDLDLQTLVSAHRETAALATLAVAKRQTSRYLRFDAQLKLCGWENRGSGESAFWDSRPFQAWAFNGIQVLSSQIFDYMQGFGGSFSTIPVYLKAAESGERIMAFPMDDTFWIDIGTLDKLELLREHLK